MEQGIVYTTSKLAKPLYVIIVEFSFLREKRHYNAQPFKCVMHDGNLITVMADCTVNASTYFSLLRKYVDTLYNSYFPM